MGEVGVLRGIDHIETRTQHCDRAPWAREGSLVSRPVHPPSKTADHRDTPGRSDRSPAGGPPRRHRVIQPESQRSPPPAACTRQCSQEAIEPAAGRGSRPARAGIPAGRTPAERAPAPPPFQLPRCLPPRQRHLGRQPAGWCTDTREQSQRLPPRRWSLGSAVSGRHAAAPAEWSVLLGSRPARQHQSGPRAGPPKAIGTGRGTRQRGSRPPRPQKARPARSPTLSL